MWHRIRRFFKTPKGLVTIVLAFLILMAAPGQGGHPIAGLACAAMAAGLVDLVILRWRTGEWKYPSGAVLTAAIVVMVLRAQEPLYVTTLTSVIAILSKYCFRSRGANIFNPAAIAIIASNYLFHTGESWWGAQSDTNGLAKLLMIAAGVIVTNRVNKMPLVLTFLAAYFGLFSLMTYGSDPLKVAEIFRTPDAEATLYFAFIILTDPPTSPVRYRDQMMCGALVAVVSYAFFQWAGVVYFLLAGVTVGNVFVAWQRVVKGRRPSAAVPRALYSPSRKV